MQAAGAEAQVDASASQARRNDLRAGYYPVLASRGRRDRRIWM
jgi:hypothetical protein